MILVPVDGSKESMQAAELAIDLAKKYGARMVLIHVINVDQYVQAMGFYRVSLPDPVKRRIEEEKQEASEWFEKIKKNAEREKASLIVIGTRGRTGFSKLLLGSVASGVVTYAPCPVMVAR